MRTRNTRKMTDKPKRAPLLLFLLCLLTLRAVSSSAEDIIWDGAGAPPGVHPNPSFSGAPALIPSEPSGNTVTVTADVNGYVFGGGVYDKDTANVLTSGGNAVNISGAAVSGDVLGGGAYSVSGDATTNNNVVSVSNGATVSGDVSGGEAYSVSGAATASGNSISVSGSAVDILYGGHASSTSGDVTASGNNISVSGSAVDNGFFGGYAYSDEGAATASGNSISVSGSEVDDVYGGYAHSTSGDVTASGNNISVSDSEVLGSFIFGGNADSYEGAATASGNSISVSGSKVIVGVAGGYAESYEGAATASGNSISVSGSEVKLVYGGLADSDSGTAAAIHNAVTLSGATSIGEDLLGGVGAGGAGGDFFTGNTLNVVNPDKTNGVIVGGNVGNFEFYNFTYQADAANGAVGLATNGTAYLNDQGASPVASVINSVNIMSGGEPLKEGDSLTLIAAGSLDANGFTQTTVTGKKGAALLYNYDLAATNGKLTATVTGGKINPQMKALSEGRAGGAAFLNSGADLIAEAGMLNAWGRQREPYNSYTFGAASYGAARRKTGSRIDVEGFSVMGGIARDFQKAGGRLTLGVFVESGWGNYDAYNDFANYAAINSSGDTNYYGLGIAARYGASGDGKGRFYADGSLRFGKTEMDFTSNLLDPVGVNARYDSDATYFGAHFGFGYIRNLSESSDLDLYTKLLWTRHGSDTVTISTGDPVKFSATDSVRWRTGLRYGRLLRGDKFRCYIGAAYEHEFGGDADATVYGRYAIDAPSLKGGTGIVEIGFTYKKSPDDPFSLDFNVSGCLGEREGISGRLEASWTF